MLAIFSDAFLYGNLKDIVSGDFCWLTEGVAWYFLLWQIYGHGVPVRL
jgi:hypothetical protein